jgi:hypothetical protein
MTSAPAAESVAAFLASLDHRFQREILALREIFERLSFPGSRRASSTASS